MAAKINPKFLWHILLEIAHKKICSGINSKFPKKIELNEKNDLLTIIKKIYIYIKKKKLKKIKKNYKKNKLINKKKI